MKGIQKTAMWRAFLNPALSHWCWVMSLVVIVSGASIADHVHGPTGLLILLAGAICALLVQLPRYVLAQEAGNGC